MICTPLTIPNGSSVSNVIGVENLQDALSLLVESPANLDADTFTFEVSQDNVTFVTLSDGTADIVVPAASKGIVYKQNCFGAAQFLRIKSSGNVAADRVFKVTKQFEGI